jgi:hypothetical protein
MFLRPEERRIDGDPVLLKPSVWLDQNRSINGITWAPGMPLVVFDKVIVESIGWIDAPGKTTFNTYRAPTPEKGDPRKAGPWLKLVRKVGMLTGSSSGLPVACSA